MTLLEVYNKPGFGHRLRKLAAPVDPSLKKIGPGLYTSIPAHGGHLPPPPLPATPVVTGLPAAGDATGTKYATITLAAPPGGLAAPVTARITYNIGAGPQTLNVPLALGDSTPTMATKLAAASWPTELTALAATNTVKVTPADGTTLTALSVVYS
jgi:hypothetical protein